MAAKRVDKEVDALYALPPGDFTKARDELSRRLRKEGRREDADAVKGLRKPTAAAYALNQLARRRGKDVERLLAAGKRLRKAHEKLLSGGDRDALQKATAEERELVDRLTRDATAVASEAGASTSASFDEHLRNTLHAAALDDATARELTAGRLQREREPVGMFGAGTAAPAEAAAPRKRGDPKQSQADERTRRRDLEHAAKAARTEQQRAEREHARAVKAAEKAARAAADAQQRADDARNAQRDADRQARDAAQALERATRDAEAAERELR